MYDTYVTMCVSFTSVHIDLHALRATDGQWYIQYLNRLNRIGNERKRKRAQAQALSYSRREQRLRVVYSHINPDPES